MVPAHQLDTFRTALLARVLDCHAGFSKRHLRQFVSEIRFDGNRVVMREKRAAWLVAAAQKDFADGQFLAFVDRIKIICLTPATSNRRGSNPSKTKNFLLKCPRVTSRALRATY